MQPNFFATIQRKNQQRISSKASQISRWRHTDPIKKYIFISIIFFLTLCITICSCTFLAAPWIAGTTLIILVLLWLLSCYPHLAVLFVFLCAGLPSMQVPLPGHTVRPVEISLALCALLVLLTRPYIRLQAPHVFALLFLILATISFLHVPEFSTNATIFGANKRLYNLLTIIIGLFCGTFLTSFTSDQSSLLRSILISNIPLYLISLAQALNLSLPSFLSSDQNPALTGDGGRLVGPFNGAATFGIYLTGLFAISLSCALLGSCRRDRLTGMFMMFATILALVGSGTRSALIAIIVMLAIGLVVTKNFKAFIGILTLALGSLAMFPNIILSHFTHADTSTSNRIFLWKEALNLIVTHPIIGIGLEQFHYYYSRLIISQSTQLNQHGISIHNQYLEWGVEGGIFWLALGIMFFLSIIILCMRRYTSAIYEQRPLLLAAALAAIATMITSFLDVPFDDVEGGVFLCMLVGLALGSVIQFHSFSKKRTLAR